MSTNSWGELFFSLFVTTNLKTPACSLRAYFLTKKLKAKNSCSKVRHARAAELIFNSKEKPIKASAEEKKISSRGRDKCLRHSYQTFIGFLRNEALRYFKWLPALLRTLLRGTTYLSANASSSSSSSSSTSWSSFHVKSEKMFVLVLLLCMICVHTNLIEVAHHLSALRFF